MVAVTTFPFAPRRFPLHPVAVACAGPERSSLVENWLFPPQQGVWGPHMASAAMGQPTAPVSHKVGGPGQDGPPSPASTHVSPPRPVALMCSRCHWSSTTTCRPTGRTTSTGRGPKTAGGPLMEARCLVLGALACPTATPFSTQHGTYVSGADPLAPTHPSCHSPAAIYPHFLFMAPWCVGAPWGGTQALGRVP